MTTTKLFGKTPLLIAFALLASALQAAAAVFTVSNAKDRGAGSLRAAIEQANTNGEEDTINFDPTFFNVARTITLTSGEILLTPDDQHFNGQTGRLVTINGPGANLLTISGGNASRIFLLAGNPGQEQQNANVTMSGMTLRDGNGVSTLSSSGYGGAIFANLAANLTLNSMVIRNNVVTAVANGGGISTNGVTKTEINDSLITENSAYGGGGLVISNENQTFTMRNTIVSNNRAIPGDVGGISIYRGTVDIKNCQITGNIADRSRGGMDVYQAQVLNVSDTTISGNDGMEDNGGGLSTDGADIVNLLRLTVSNNKGTGIGIRSPSGTITIKDSTISNNSLRDFQFFSGEVGGGIYIAPQSSTVKIINTTVSGNSAPHAAGGIWTQGDDTQLINCTVVNNSVFNSDGSGGGIYDGQIGNDGNFGNRIKLQNTIVANNTAPIGPDLRIQVTSLGYNIIGNTTGSGDTSPTTGDQFNVDPKIGPLADNGGATLTHALLSGSRAINAGKNALAVDENGIALTADQRAGAFQRVVSGRVDIGAFEVQPPPNTQPGNNVTKSSAAGDASVTFPRITRAGLTRFSAINPASAGTPPRGYTLQTRLPAYEINTTAGFTLPLLVSLTVPTSVSKAEFNRLRILHREDGALVDRTILPPEAPAPNFVTRTIYARVNSLSPFVLANAPGQLQNISTRLRVQTGDNALIGGFIITGELPKKVVLRAIGPSLSKNGITGALADPTMELRRSDGTLVTRNNNWRDTQQAKIIATGIPPTNDLESAIVATLPPDNYTAVVRGANNAVGIGLIEVYDLDPDGASKLANISTRGFVESGDSVMIGGFIVGPAITAARTKVIVRAIGPDLTTRGVPGALSDTTLQLFDANGMIGSNDNWRSTQEQEIIATTIPPNNDLESAIVANLAPGNYTAIVRGKGGSTGVGLIEVYILQ